MTRRRAGLVVTVVGMTLGIAVPSAPAQVPPSSTTTTRPPLTFTLPSATVAPTTTTTSAVTSTSSTEVTTEAPTTTTTTTAKQEPTTITAPASTEAPATTTTFVPPAGLPADGGGAGETDGDERRLLLDAGTGSPGVFVALSLGGGATAMAIMAVQWFRTRRDPWS